MICNSESLSSSNDTFECITLFADETLSYDFGINTELFLSLSSPLQGELEEQTLVGESQTPADADTKAPYGGYCTIA
ncbi:hypothetical protein EST38_g11938 [Candolleomyces aberdarensis]|uniref:Pheromone n=1 Tax=Candolleomyces aberdarensis TaxID=2316362 RepID=A0A4Q2D5Y0_9AGAR|nr:hypothetical protein EST38_g11938 [Candolleomyces aberdarensis]